MTISPVQFAQAFEKLRSDLAALPESDHSLILLSDFWEMLQAVINRQEYASFVHDYSALLTAKVNNDSIADLNLEDLTRLVTILDSLLQHNSQTQMGESLASCRKILLHHQAQILLWVGETDKGVQSLANSIGISEVEKFAPESDADANPIEQLRQAIVYYKTKSPLLSDALGEINTNWGVLQDEVHLDRINCLFVDRFGGRVSGRMRPLVGTVDRVTGQKATHDDADKTTDQVVFGLRPKSPDDPFVQVAYKALKAIRPAVGNFGLKLDKPESLRAFLTVKGTGQSFSGDSIGLATAAVAFTQLMKTQLHRDERFIASDIAITGGIDDNGQVTSVNGVSLNAKVERVFFSPMRFLVVPEGDLESVRVMVKSLNTQYPLRRLSVIGVQSLSELLENRNIIRSERMCFAPYVARQAVRYTRMTKLQVPLLLMLLYAATCLIYPKAWVGFDYHIARIEVQGNRFKTINPDGHTLWWSQEYESALYQSTFEKKMFCGFRMFVASDVDKDNRDELFVLPGTASEAQVLQMFDGEGNMAWSVPVFVKTTYPGDIDLIDYRQKLDYRAVQLVPVFDTDSTLYILVTAESSPPVRHQFLLFDTFGKLASGPYLHPGGLWRNQIHNSWDANGDGIRDLIITGTNNIARRSALYILDPFKLAGVGPPWDDELFVSSGMDSGSSLFYVSFPKTEVSSGNNVRCYTTNVDRDIESGALCLTVVEGINQVIAGKTLSDDSDLPALVYCLDSQMTPMHAYFPDAYLGRMNLLRSQLGLSPITDSRSYLDSLMRQIIIYKNGRIVPNPFSVIP